MQLKFEFSASTIPPNRPAERSNLKMAPFLYCIWGATNSVISITINQLGQEESNPCVLMPKINAFPLGDVLVEYKTVVCQKPKIKPLGLAGLEPTATPS